MVRRFERDPKRSKSPGAGAVNTTIQTCRLSAPATAVRLGASHRAGQRFEPYCENARLHPVARVRRSDVVNFDPPSMNCQNNHSLACYE